MAEEKKTRNRSTANGEGGCKYIENKKLWCSRITIGWDGTKQIRKAFYGKTKREALSKGTAAQARVMNGQAATSSDMKLSDWSKKWMSDYKSGLSPRTVDQYQGIVNNQIIPAIGNYALKDLKQSHIQKMINDLLKNNYSSSTIKHTKQYTFDMLECALDDNLLIQNPARKIKLPKMKKTKTERGAFTSEEEIKIIAFAPSYLTQDKPHVPHIIGKAIITMLKSGMRTEELLALPWRNVDLKNRTIKIDCAVSLEDYKAYIKGPKSEASYRPIPIHDKIYDILLEMKQPENKDTTIFCNTLKEIWEPHIFYHQYVNYFKALNKSLPENEKVQYRSPHACRHTFASDLNLAHVDPKTIAALLGHAHADISIDVYSHTNSQQIKSAIELI